MDEVDFYLEDLKSKFRKLKNVEQLLLEKINAEQEAEQLNYIVTELKRWLEMYIESYKFYGNYERADAYDMVLYRLKELTGEKEEK